MRKRSLLRCIAWAVLAAGALPAGLALAVTLHVELEHGHHGDAHRDGVHASEAHASEAHPGEPHRGGDSSHREATELAQALGHGHSHAVDDPGHEHAATRAPAPAGADRPWAVGTAHQRLLVPAVLAAAGGPELAPPRQPPPRDLFILHCALLR